MNANIIGTMAVVQMGLRYVVKGAGYVAARDDDI